MNLRRIRIRQGWRIFNVALFAVAFTLFARRGDWVEAGIVGFFLVFAIVILAIWLQVEHRDAARR